MSYVPKDFGKRGFSNMKKHKTKKITVKKVLIAILLVIIAMVAAVGIYAAVIISGAQKINPDDIYSILNESTVIYDDQGKVYDTIFEDSDRDNVSYKEMPKNLRHAFIALEDKSFEKHHGFNYIRIAGAIAESITGRKQISGTSTITQQLARNLYLKETQYDHNLKRKIIEAHYTRVMEKKLTKSEILEAYLNTIYLGNNCSGVEAASRSYFSKDAKDLSLAQCAALATLPQSPSNYALVKFVVGGNPEEYGDNVLKQTPQGIYVANDISKSRRETCLKLMKDQGYITDKEYKEAKAVKLKDMLNPSYSNEGKEATYYSDYVIEEVISDLVKEKKLSRREAEEKVYNGGLKIYSCLDSQAQSVMDEKLSNRANYPSMSYTKDGAGNILNRNGSIALYAYNNYFNEEGNFTLDSSEFSYDSKGNLVVYNGKRLNIYDTKVDGKTDYSLEFKPIYVIEDGQLMSMNGGYINIPAEYKTKDNNGNLVISKKYLDKEKTKKVIVKEESSVVFKTGSYTLKKKVIQPQVAMAIVDNKTGQVKAMSGGRESTGRKTFNRAINPRQPGSSIKPLGVYGPAVQQSEEEVKAGKKHTYRDFHIDKQGDKYYGDYLTPASPVIDEKTVIDGRVWPKNAMGDYSGNQTMTSSMEQSINTCAVKILYQVGLDYSYDMVKKFGITTLDANYDKNIASLALGGMSHGVTPLEMASAYTVFPNNGTRKDVTSYTKVLDHKGNLFIKSKAEEHRVMSPAAAYVTADMLKKVVSHGIGGNAAISGVQVGGKTGTTDDSCDFWFDGFTPTYSAALWIGNDSNFQLTGYSDQVAALWGSIMRNVKRAYGGSYTEPDGVVHAKGMVLIKGTEKNTGKAPDELKDDEIKIEICTDTGMLATPDCPHKKEVIVKKEDAPKYYCSDHNPDKKKYPIAPEEVENSDKDKPSENTNSTEEREEEDTDKDNEG